MPSKTPATGMGWGGPAKGAGNGNLITIEGRENGLRVMHGMTPDEKQRRYLHSQECADRMREILANVAEAGDGDGVKAMAAVKLHELIEKSIAARGTAKAENDFSKLTTAELETVQALMKKTLR